MDFAFLRACAPFLFDGLLNTLILTVAGSIGALSLGFIVGVGRASRRRWVAIASRIYVEGLRNVPVIVHMFILYFALELDAIPAGIIGLALYGSAYMAEIFRGAITAVPQGLTEAGLALNLSRFKILRLITVPIAVSFALPALTTEVVNVLKNSTVAMAISVTELTYASQEIETQTFRGFDAATIVTVLYLLLAGIIIGSIFLLERRIATWHMVSKMSS